MVSGLVLAVLLGPYLFYRAFSFSERLKWQRLPDVDVPAAKFEGTLKVAAWNIAHGRGTAKSNWNEKPEPKVGRIVEIAHFIRELDADVVVLNEVDFSATWSGGLDQGQTIAVHAGYPYYARQCNMDLGFLFGRWQFGNAILSRYPIEDAEVVELPALKEWEDWLAGHKRGLVCTMVLTPNTRINVMGLHLESRGEQIRVDSVKALSEQIAGMDGPLVVAGDLNTTPSAAPFANHTSQGENAFDTLIKSTGMLTAAFDLNDPAQLTFPAWKPKTAIDWVLCTPDDFKVVGHKVHHTQLSDHLPVTMQMRLDKPSDRP